MPLEDNLSFTINHVLDVLISKCIFLVFFLFLLSVMQMKVQTIRNSVILI